jgi:nicotinamidase-related amidase
MTKENVALLLLDLQKEAVDEKGLFGKAGLFGDQGIAKEVVRKDLLPKARGVLDRARAAGMTIVHVGTKYRPGYPELGKGHPVFDQVKALNTYVEGSWGVDFQDPVAPKGNEVVVWKHKVSAFYQTDLHLILATKGIRTIVALGVALNNVVESTAREAADMGFDVIVLRDCCASFDAQQDDFACARILPRFCRVIDSGEFVKEIGI